MGTPICSASCTGVSTHRPRRRASCQSSSVTTVRYFSPCSSFFLNHLVLSSAREPERQQREKPAREPGQGADYENQGEKAPPPILEPHRQRLDLRHQRPRRLVPRLDLRYAALQVPVAGKNRFLQLERFRIEAPRFFERLVDARHYRLKTEFILDYLSQPALRTRIRRGLLKGEQLHTPSPGASTTADWADWISATSNAKPARRAACFSSSQLSFIGRFGRSIVF